MTKHQFVVEKWVSQNIHALWFLIGRNKRTNAHYFSLQYTYRVKLMNPFCAHSKLELTTYQGLSCQWLGKNVGYRLELSFQLHAAKHRLKGPISLGQSFSQHCRERKPPLASWHSICSFLNCNISTLSQVWLLVAESNSKY